MEPDRLAQLLDGPGDAARACRSALLDGAELTSWGGAAPANRMLPAYERRRAQSIASGATTVGFDEALSGLRDAGMQAVRLFQVTVSTPPCVFMVFLAGDPVGVIACFGVQSKATGPTAP
jgi:hypothetical protein